MVTAVQVVVDVCAVLGAAEVVLASVGGKGVCARVAAVVKDLLGLAPAAEAVAASPTVETAVEQVPQVIQVVEKVVADAKKD